MLRAKCIMPCPCTCGVLQVGKIYDVEVYPADDNIFSVYDSGEFVVLIDRNLFQVEKNTIKRNLPEWW